MARSDTAQVDERTEKVLPITDPDRDNDASPGAVSKRPFVLDKKRGSSEGNLPLMLLVVGVIAVFAIGMVAFLSSKGTTKRKTATEAAKPNLGRAQIATAPGDLIPSDKVKPSPDEPKPGGNVDASDIERTKSPKVAQTQTQTNLGSLKAGKRLSDVGKFDEPDTTPNGDGKWTPPSYGSASPNDQLAAKKEDETLSKPSVVFVAHQQAKPHSGSIAGMKPVDNLGLVPGYHVAARLEMMATTAVHAPVTAIIEYNYERDGQILIPAGSRAVGKISQADPSGLMNITFSSIEFPSGETVAIDAVAADMTFQALKGKVTGKQAGKSLMVRSLSGIGETAAMIVGAPSQNSAFSENDLLRMRIADNMGSAGDEQIMKMMTMEHIVVTVPAGTEIYVIFEKSSTAKAATEEKLQIPAELNAGAESISAPQP
jgi:hypothetical protein